jgi:hypothetical protein
MAQHDYVIANGTGAAVRSDLNNALAAIVSQNSGATAPTTTYAYMPWADTGSSPPVFKIRNAANNGWITLYQLDGEWSTIALENGTAGAPSIYFKDSGTDTGIYSPGTDQVAISTGGTSRLTIDASGNVNIDSNTLYVDASNNRVGLGTSSVGSLLHLKQDIAESATLNAAGSHLQINSGSGSGTNYRSTIFFAPLNSSGNGSPAAISAIASGNTNSSLGFYTNPANDYSGIPDLRMLIDSSGNVGIGTTSPSATLHVVGDALFTNASPIINLPGSAVNQTAKLRNANGGSSVLQLESASLVFANDSSIERARIDSSGRLLVGTSSDSQTSTLVLKGNSAGVANAGTLRIERGQGAGNITSSNIELGTIALGGSAIPSALVQAYSDGNWTAGTSYPTRLVFSVTADGSASPTEAMRINNAGELLVGYTSDNGAYKLQVNSQIFATSATIATSDGRYKENVATLGGCLDLVKALRPVSFTWKPQEDITRIDDEGNEVLVREGHNFPEGIQVGFIAQEVQEVLADKPWMSSVIKENVRPVVKDNEGNELAPEEQFYGIAEGNLIAVLTNALQEAVTEIESLKARLDAANL